MGKVRALRARVHQAAVKPRTDPTLPVSEAGPPPARAGGAGAKDWGFLHTNIFTGTQIDPSTLVQRLEVDVRSVASLGRGAEVKAILPKKEKLRQRRERWLKKIEAIKLAEQKRKEERKRQAMVVVGDLHPLRDALPKLEELEAYCPPPPRVKVSSKPRPAQLSRMSAAQRQQLLEEERTRFQKLLTNPAYRASPLLAIGQQLALQMQLEDTGHL
ncbi:protein FAM207A [Octodon degus]|uniref:Protein FAM207A n=1 Tax=Octodon degus TaxID=10160 RepID=A0A6P3F517_OCTDE|nr:protein FAM207A [Octodon degus]